MHQKRVLAMLFDMGTHPSELPVDYLSAREALLREADRIIGGLSPGKRESVRELVVEARRAGRLSRNARAFLDRATGSAFVADLLEAMLAEPAPLDALAGGSLLAD